MVMNNVKEMHQIALFTKMTAMGWDILDVARVNVIFNYDNYKMLIGWYTTYAANFTGQKDLF